VEDAARRKGRSVLLRACGLRGLRALSFGHAAGFGFRRAGIDVLALMMSGDRGDSRPTNHGAQRLDAPD
jgi:hypothetical protein